MNILLGRGGCVVSTSSYFFSKLKEPSIALLIG